MEIFTVFNVVRVFVVAAISFVVAMLLTFPWYRILLKYFAPGKEIARPDKPVFTALHKKKEGTPVMGGFVIWLTVAILALVFWFLANTVDGFWSKMNFLSRGQTLLPLGYLVLAGLVGMTDDILGIFKRKGFSISRRLILYFLVAAIGAWWFYFKLDWDFITIPFLGDWVVSWWYIPIFIFVTVATAFSANETDGLDGLSGGVFMTAFAAFGAIAFVQGRMDLAVFIAAILGALIAFLWFNIYPAKFFMGDTGVMALGFVLGAIAMLTNTVLLLPIICIIMVLESLSVIVQLTSKKLRGKKIFHSTPIHHHFEALGWPETQITMRFWIISAIGALLGLVVFLVDSKIPPLWHLFK
ncbi:MAG: phospho-N-acetylmuramoyl-pentapeptide-transferase [Candidatus Yanofskybacteria bacterium RIFCSPLOWO2_02_FULL_45_10]|uniref:Phospho-N-acetylmuramoyl-pentapeptide-transferase n=2 Tax=Candidatus Yanofskyibacteriota TaxID=1752733 RepID=A0A1F8G524_9BACT|nr:MAG: phospho-N-acetylmuramoyl-pentapeptide-transferase [Candidatus Yanofskybacteria bacterium RIFCSPHIGHO2_12_FULL_45_19b]OGN31505.1 MAG: phospho-N-acetylmuramoyl-pentapeptide-transferase [Candidatus Yanofskybacteria bacterium RIFCSPLOWO2_02_FULL_45_10]